MPPQRTFPPVKAVKTERTHEENQERAYIAASRRSDRSLEARVESARRASEIHKRRTGRSLRVTEQDVINEEMYEEEDDDLPMQYRRLTAHLQTGSADFNRRLAAYLTNHVAMRSALDEAVNNSFAQQYPNAPQFAHNHTIFPSPLSTHGTIHPPQSRSPSVAQPFPHPYRQVPYPTASQKFKNQHSRSASFAAPQDGNVDKPPLVQNNDSSLVQQPSRRASMSDVSSLPNATASKTVPLAASTNVSVQASDSGEASKDYVVASPQNMAPIVPSIKPEVQIESYADYNPLTTTLPSESQLLLGSPFDFMHQSASSRFNGQEGYVPDFGYDLSSISKQTNFCPRPGINATLAPSALEFPSSQNSLEMMSHVFSPSQKSVGNDGTDWNFNDFRNFNPGTNSALASGNVTPGLDAGWEAFINDNSWSDNTT